MKKKIKVMHFVSGLVSGGVEEMLYNYCNYMDHKKYEFIIVYQHEPVITCKEKIESAGCRTVRITARSENFMKNIKESEALIKAEEPDIVHTHMNLMNFCALSAAKKAGTGVRICHSHIAEKNKSKPFEIMAAICKWLCIKNATALFTCGLEAGEYLYGRKRMESGNVKMVENAIDLNQFKVDEALRTEVREKYNLSGKFVIGHVGRFSYQKNHERLISIFAELLKYKENAALLLAGTGELEEKIKYRCEKLGLEDKVIFYGTTKNIMEVYSAIDVFVLPSRFEGFPVVSIELQASDIPSIFSDTIEPACKVTEAIQFLSLNNSDLEWSKAIISAYENKKSSDIDKLTRLYNIREKAKDLSHYYSALLGGVQWNIRA